MNLLQLLKPNGELHHDEQALILALILVILAGIVIVSLFALGIGIFIAKVVI